MSRPCTDITLEELKKQTLFCILEDKKAFIIAIIREKDDICEGYMVKIHSKRGIEVDSFVILQKELVTKEIISKHYDLTKDFDMAVKYLEKK
jgi:hypothetical protein